MHTKLIKHNEYITAMNLCTTYTRYIKTKYSYSYFIHEIPVTQNLVSKYQNDSLFFIPNNDQKPIQTQGSKNLKLKKLCARASGLPSSDSRLVILLSSRPSSLISGRLCCICCIHVDIESEEFILLC